MEPDLESFPLLRPDQIPLLSSEWLQRSVGELALLLTALQTDGNSSDSLLHYAEQQQASVVRELSRREDAMRLSTSLGLTNPHFFNPFMATPAGRPAGII
jgi:hypothetical protein